MNKIIYEQYLKKLNEAPLPKGYDPDYLNPMYTKTSYDMSVKELRTKIENMGGEDVGQGSSRIAFKLMMDPNDIDPEIVKKFNLEMHDGKVKTVIKLALNGEGIAQNKSELNFQRKYGINEFFMPIIDDSESNKGLQWGDKNLSNWIQMPYGREPGWDEWKKRLYYMFGISGNRIDHDQLVGIVKYGFVPSGSVMGRTQEQFDRLVRFVDIMEKTGMRGRDISRPEQWGVYNDKMYIIDYGYDDTTTQYYQGGVPALTFVNKSGNITMDVKKVVLTPDALKKIKKAMPILLDIYKNSFIDAVESYVGKSFDKSIFLEDELYFNTFLRTILTYPIRYQYIKVLSSTEDDLILNKEGIHHYKDLYNNYIKLDGSDIQKYGEKYEYLNNILLRDYYTVLINLTDLKRYHSMNSFIEEYADKLDRIYNIDLGNLK